eukprot:TRINITY_DN3720_c0_g2_i1.p1 TRINITY_DN3720_c0_g2~~TRINITY_DN3720_c0_g2_i1.p1  ORF type:complete len:777 (-),score=263.53 TRINITY_DN3720_c0_g2_i1:2-2332(-)
MCIRDRAAACAEPANVTAPVEDGSTTAQEPAPEPATETPAVESESVATVEAAPPAPEQSEPQPPVESEPETAEEATAPVQPAETTAVESEAVAAQEEAAAAPEQEDEQPPVESDAAAPAPAESEAIVAEEAQEGEQPVNDAEADEMAVDDEAAAEESGGHSVTEEQVKQAVKAVLSGENLYKCELSMRQIRDRAADNLGCGSKGLKPHKKLVKTFVGECIDEYQKAHPVAAVPDKKQPKAAPAVVAGADGWIRAGVKAWAKMHSYPWWPCRVTDKEARKGSHWVIYFGTGERSQLKSSNLIPFEDNKSTKAAEGASTKRWAGDLAEAVQEAETYVPGEGDDDGRDEEEEEEQEEPEDEQDEDAKASEEEPADESEEEEEEDQRNKAKKRKLKQKSETVDKPSKKPAKEKKPKKAATAYQLFNKANYQEATGANFGEKQSFLSTKWKEMTAEDKEVYEKQAALAKAEWDAQEIREGREPKPAKPTKERKRPKPEPEDEPAPKKKKKAAKRVATVEEVTGLLDDLEKAVATDNTAVAVTRIEALGAFMISKEVLLSTGVGIELNKLRKCEDDLIQRTAGNVRKVLMQQLKEESKGNQGTADSTRNEEPVPDRPKDHLRVKVRSAMASLFKPHPDAEERATELEIGMYEQSVIKEEGYEDELNETKYKDKFKMLRINLGRNEQLRTSLLDKSLVSYDLVRMEQKDMATQEQVERITLLKEEAWKDAQVAETPMDETDQFQCGKCRKKRCIYFQKQTRSADEPMTTFIKCKECGNNWKEC